MNIFGMMKKHKQSLLYLAASVGFLAVGGVAHAANLGDVANNIGSSVDGGLSLLMKGSYFAGSACAAGALFKFKQHSDNPQQTPMKVPVILAVVAAGLLALPSFRQTSTDTVWGNGQAQSAYSNNGH